ncbi:MAG: GNAT family N-acetyltransferase [Glaciecola sp.]
MQSLHAIKVDYRNEQHMAELTNLLQMYANDPMGGNAPIANDVLEKLPQALQARPFMYSLLVYENQLPVAFANCIESFSTFSASGVMNIHDFAVVPSHRGRGVSQFLMQEIAELARGIGCTKLTLEVLAGNTSAVRAYEKAGFTAYQLSPEMGDAMFWQKPL